MMDAPITGEIIEDGEVIDLDAVDADDLLEALDEGDHPAVHSAVAVVAERGMAVVGNASLRRAGDRRLEMISEMLPDRAVFQIAVTLLRGTGTDASRLRYAQDLRIFLTWAVAEKLDPRDATRDDLVTFLDSIKHYKVTSQRRLATVVRLFYRELEARSMTRGPNPTIMLPKIRGKADEQPAGFSEKQARDLLVEIEERINGSDRVQKYLAVRDYAIVHLALTSGIRASEIVGLTCGDIRTEQAVYWVVQVHGKGRKDRVVPIQPRTVEVITRYKTAMADLGVVLADTDPLFIRIGPKAEPDGAQAMTTRNLAKLVTKWVDAANMGGPRKAVHQLRRTAATIARENGAQIDQIADMLGHADVRTTRDLYIKPADKLRNSATKFINL